MVAPANNNAVCVRPGVGEFHTPIGQLYLEAKAYA